MIALLFASESKFCQWDIRDLELGRNQYIVRHEFTCRVRIIIRFKLVYAVNYVPALAIAMFASPVHCTYCSVQSAPWS